MDHHALPTEFAPAERAPEADLLQDAALFTGTLLGRTLNALPIGILVLNEQRQIIFCNRRFCILTPRETDEGVLGLRPGEALGCVHAEETGGGCGTTAFCRHCGAARAIISALRGLGGVKLCHILRHAEKGVEALELQIHTTPLEFEGRSFVLFSAIDVSSEQRLLAMERIFFHDVLNTASGIVGLGEVLRDELPGEHARVVSMLSGLSDQLVDEIKNQKDLFDAERGELVPETKPLDVSDLLKAVVGNWSGRKEAEGVVLELERVPEQGAKLVSDPVLVRRVVSNMVKNALEASGAGDVVRLGAEVGEREASVWVSNPAVMPEEVRRQVFNRFYSTKGPGRGLGTYGMKLLAERYLGGRVEFESAPETGTVFRLVLPVS